MEMSREDLLLIQNALNSHINELLDRKDMIERRRYRAGILSEEYELLNSDTEASLYKAKALDNKILDFLLRDSMLSETEMK